MYQYYTESLLLILNYFDISNTEQFLFKEMMDEEAANLLRIALEEENARKKMPLPSPIPEGLKRIMNQRVEHSVQILDNPYPFADYLVMEDGVKYMYIKGLKYKVIEGLEHPSRFNAQGELVNFNFFDICRYRDYVYYKGTIRGERIYGRLDEETIKKFNPKPISTTELMRYNVYILYDNWPVVLSVLVVGGLVVTFCPGFVIAASIPLGIPILCAFTADSPSAASEAIASSSS